MLTFFAILFAIFAGLVNCYLLTILVGWTGAVVTVICFAVPIFIAVCGVMEETWWTLLWVFVPTGCIAAIIALILIAVMVFAVSLPFIIISALTATTVTVIVVES